MGRKKILVVEDSAVVVAALSRKLRAHGYAVFAATDGAAAVGAVRREKPDLILLDISFPPDVGHGGGVPWDGFLILEWLRRMDLAKNIPVIVVTGGDPARYWERAMAAGAANFFLKPVNNEELLATISQTLRQSEQAAQPVS